MCRCRRLHTPHLTPDTPHLAPIQARNNFPQFTDPQLFEQFIGGHQRAVFRDCIRGEEKEFFQQKRAALCRILRTMPLTGETEKQEGSPVAYLRYFAGGQAQFHITELDKGAPDDSPEQFQWQMFGLSDLFGDGGELGYICLPELHGCHAELDFHYTPQTLDELRDRK